MKRDAGAGTLLRRIVVAAGRAPSPVFAMLLAACVTMAGAVLAQAPSDTPTNPFRDDPAAVQAGRKTFEETCSACHGAGGVGDRGPALNTGRFAHGDQDYDLFNAIQKGIPAGGMPSFSSLPPNTIWQVVSYVRSLSAGPAPAAGARPATGPATGAASAGDPAAAKRGEALFFGAAGCGGCHEVNGRGQSLASDLSAVGAKGEAAIRAGLLHPAARSPKVLDLTLADGRKVRGVLETEDSFNLIVRTLDGGRLRLDRRSVQSSTRVAEGLSPAPIGQPGDLGDIVAYLSRQTGRAVTGAIPAATRAGPDSGRLIRSATEPQNWLSYWGGYDGRHFSELDQIRTANVGGLQARWAAQLPGPSILQATPIVVDGVMYVSGPPGDVYALDARTGQQIWKFHRKQDVTNPYQINPSNRGVAVLNGRVFVGTLDDLLIAIDAHTGRELWERRIADTLEGYTITGAPLAVKDKIVVGVGCGEYGVRGFLEAYDPETGKRLWRFETIPGPGEPGNETWPGETWKRGGGGTWMTGSFDPELNQLYWTVGNPAPGDNWKVREGDNLHSNSVVALDPDTGKLKWSYQFTPNDSHDWDSVQDVVLADRVIDGRPRKLLMQADRNGFFYVLDRTDGAFISGRQFVHQTWNDGFDAKGRPRTRPDSKASPEGQVVFPTTSATNFQAPSYDAKTGMFYLAFRDAEGFASYGPPEFEKGKLYIAAGRPAPPPSTQPYYGIRALDPMTGATRWVFRLTAFTPGAGVLATRGGLLFAASAEGNLIAFDNRDGKPLWRFRTGGLITASPMSYAVDGRQYVAISAGNSVLSFALPGADAAPPPAAGP